MSLVTKSIKGHNYLVLEAGRGRSIYLGPAGSTNPDDFKSQNVKEGLEYVFGRISNYIDIYLRLLSLLPEIQRKPYISRMYEFEQRMPKEGRRRLVREAKTIAVREFYPVVVGLGRRVSIIASDVSVFIRETDKALEVN